MHSGLVMGVAVGEESRDYQSGDPRRVRVEGEQGACWACLQRPW